MQIFICFEFRIAEEKEKAKLNIPYTKLESENKW